MRTPFQMLTRAEGSADEPMSSEEAEVSTFKYNFSLKERSPQDDLDDTSKKAIQSFVNSALGLMTGGCEVCVYSRRMYCEKFHRPINVGDARCETFARRPAATIQR